MFSKFRIRQLILILALILFFVRLKVIINTLLFILLYIQALISSPSLAFAQTDYPFIDLLTSVILLIVIIIYFLAFGGKAKISQININFTSVVIIILLSFFIFAPLITDDNPDFQRDLAITKLLPPLSTVKVIHLKGDDKDSNNSIDKFIRLKARLIKKSFDESLIFADSISMGNNFHYYQNGTGFSITSDKLVFKNNFPFTTYKTFILGTDELGRDILIRLIYGARISLFIGLGSVLVSLLLGLIFGFIAGYSEGTIDTVLNRLSDMFLAFPIVFFIILVIALFGNSLLSVMVVLGFSGWMSLFKIVRSEVISIRNKDFFISAQLIGLSKTNLLLKETLPYILIPIIVNLVFQY
jgi:peptide/nickel transport system permease protein